MTLKENVVYVVMIEAGYAEEWQQVPVAVFDDKELANESCIKWNKCAKDFNSMFESFPYCGISRDWIKDVRFTLHDSIVPKITNKN